MTSVLRERRARSPVFIRSVGLAKCCLDDLSGPGAPNGERRRSASVQSERGCDLERGLCCAAKHCSRVNWIWLLGALACTSDSVSEKDEISLKCCLTFSNSAYLSSGDALIVFDVALVCDRVRD